MNDKQFKRMMSLKHKDLYFIRSSGGLVKIGITSNIQKRLANLQTSNPERLHVWAFIPRGGIALEKALHRKFINYRTSGEWFKISREIESLVDEMRGDGYRAVTRRILYPDIIDEGVYTVSVNSIEFTDIEAVERSASIWMSIIDGTSSKMIGRDYIETLLLSSKRFQPNYETRRNQDQFWRFMYAIGFLNSKYWAIDSHASVDEDFRIPYDDFDNDQMSLEGIMRYDHPKAIVELSVIDNGYEVRNTVCKGCVWHISDPSCFWVPGSEYKFSDDGHPFFEDENACFEPDDTEIDNSFDDISLEGL